MFFAFLTTLLFSCSAVSANRSVRFFGSQRANFYRLVLATGCLAAMAHIGGLGLSGPAFWWFFLSGCIGFGIGDIALFYAFPRLGSRLTILLCQCLAAPIAAITEWAWLGNRISWTEAGCGAVILAGVATALAPGKIDGVRRAVFIAGLIAGVISAGGQGMGAVVSRKAYDLSEAAGTKVDGMTAAYQRILGGLLVTGIALLPLRTRTPALNPASPLQPSIKPPRLGTEPPGTPALGTLPQPTGPPRPVSKRAGLWWVVGNAMAGPILGVSCFQWALATEKSGIVLPIVALTPIAVMPLAFLLEHDRPTPRGIVGGVIAVGGAVALAVAG